MGKKVKKEEKTNEIDVVDIGSELESSKKYIDKFHKAKNFNNDRQDAYAENMAFYQGNQHLLKKFKTETPWVISMNTPYASVAIDNRVSSLLANDYEGELVPLSEEDVESVEALSKVYEREWRRMNIDDVVRECISGSAIVREFYCHIVMNPNKSIGGKNKKTLGKLEAYAIEPSRIFIDPNARSLKDADYMFVSGRISKERALEDYPKVRALKDEGYNNTPEDRGEVYYDNDYDTEQSDVFMTLTYYGKEKGKIKKVKMINSIIIEEKEMPIKNFPILQMRWKKAAQSCYGLSLMDEILSLQKSIVSIESATTNTAMSYAAPSMMVRKGCGVDPKVVAKAAGAPGVVYAVDGNLDNAIKPVVPPKIQQEILNIKNDFITQIDNITGNSKQFLGDIGTAGNTAGGANVAVDRATIIEVKILNNIREFVSDITEVLIEFITHAYGKETITYNDGKDAKGKYTFSAIELPSSKELEDSNYKYEIELETKTPYSKQRQKDLLLEIYRLERQYDVPVKTITISDIIKNTDLENRDEIIGRFNNLTYQDSVTKAKTIDSLMTTGKENGVPEELLTQAVAEIIGNSKETPATEQVMQMLEAAFQQEIQAGEQRLNMVTNELMATPQQQQRVQQEAAQLEQQQPMM